MTDVTEVMQFHKVQFIGMCICATPADLVSIEGVSDDGYYPGFLDADKDLQERVEVIKDAIVRTIKTNKIDRHAQTLKVFVIPEFFMRGVLGAYYTANGQQFEMEKKLINLFRNSLNEVEAESGDVINGSFLFVLGSILETHESVDINAEPTKSMYYTGDNLLDIYYKLHPEADIRTKEKAMRGIAESAVYNTPFKSMLRRIDGKDTVSVESADNLGIDTGDDAYEDVLKKTLDYCDSKAEIDVYNRCLIIPGGPRVIDTESPYYSVRVVQKQHKSKEDFILNTIKDDLITDAPKYIQTIVKYPAIDFSANEYQQESTDGRAIFKHHNATIGVEICLDHSRQRLVKHLQNNPGKYVDIQIIPSCGMSVRANAVAAKKGGYVFNCDGEYTLDNSVSEEGINGVESHTTLQRVSSAYNSVENTATLESAQDIIHDEHVILTGDAKTKLFAHTEYNIHIYQASVGAAFKVQ